VLHTTARLVLRRFRIADVAAFRRYRSDPDVARYQSWTTPVSRAEARSLVGQFAAADPAQPGWFQYAIELRSDRMLIGDIGVCTRDNRLEAELGFTLAAEHQGRGYATEAVLAVLHALFARGMRRVTAECDARNLRSALLLQRVGFQNEGRHPAHTWIKGEWTDDLLFGLPADQWKRRSARLPERGDGSP
jgi:RimJ/RimL family protein N-acetyltransferase